MTGRDDSPSPASAGAAVALALAFAGLRLFMHFYLSRNIQSDYRSYGPIGVVFVLQSWFIAFSVAMLGAPLFGHFLHRRWHPDRPLISEADGPWTAWKPPWRASAPERSGEPVTTTA